MVICRNILFVISKKGTSVLKGSDRRCGFLFWLSLVYSSFGWFSLPPDGENQPKLEVFGFSIEIPKTQGKPENQKPILGGNVLGTGAIFVFWFCLVFIFVFQLRNQKTSSDGWLVLPPEGESQPKLEVFSGFSAEIAKQTRGNTKTKTKKTTNTQNISSQDWFFVSLVLPVVFWYFS